MKIRHKTSVAEERLLNQGWFWGTFGFWAGLAAYCYCFIYH